VHQTFTWNAEGELSGTTKTGLSSATYYYDAFGRIVRKDLAGSAASYFLWNGNDLLAELAANGTSKSAEYSYFGTDRLHAIVEDSSGTNKTFYAHQDALGNTIALTNSTGTASSRTYQYDDWGQLTGGTSSLPQTDKDRARWKGALWMGTESNLYYLRNRWYDPATGRFLSEDPIGLAGGVNPSLFGGSDPVNTLDPSGTECYSTILISTYTDGSWEAYTVAIHCGGGGGGSGGSSSGPPNKCSVGDWITAIAGGVADGMTLLSFVDGALVAYKIGRVMLGSDAKILGQQLWRSILDQNYAAGGRMLAQSARDLASFADLNAAPTAFGASAGLRGLLWNSDWAPTMTPIDHNNVDNPSSLLDFALSLSWSAEPIKKLISCYAKPKG
jgi:RHS repeat-associated protein